MSDTATTAPATQTVKELQAALAAAKEQAKAERDAKKAEREAAKAATAKSAQARNDLASRILIAVSRIIEESDGTEVFRQGMTQDEAAQCAAQWLHHLPTGKTSDGTRRWPGTLPKPDRADWR